MRIFHSYGDKCNRYLRTPFPECHLVTLVTKTRWRMVYNGTNYLLDAESYRTLFPLVVWLLVLLENQALPILKKKNRQTQNWGVKQMEIIHQIFPYSRLNSMKTERFDGECGKIWWKIFICFIPEFSCLIDWIVLYAVSAIFQSYNGGFVFDKTLIPGMFKKSLQAILYIVYFKSVA